MSNLQRVLIVLAALDLLTFSTLTLWDFGVFIPDQPLMWIRAGHIVLLATEFLLAYKAYAKCRDSENVYTKNFWSNAFFIAWLAGTAEVVVWTILMKTEYLIPLTPIGVLASLTIGMVMGVTGLGGIMAAVAGIWYLHKADGLNRPTY